MLAPQANQAGHAQQPRIEKNAYQEQQSSDWIILEHHLPNAPQQRIHEGQHDITLRQTIPCNRQAIPSRRKRHTSSPPYLLS